MARRKESDSDWGGEAVFSVLELLPDELWLLSVLIAIVFGLIWLLGWVFRSFFGE